MQFQASIRDLRSDKFGHIIVMAQVHMWNAALKSIGAAPSPQFRFPMQLSVCARSLPGAVKARLDAALSTDPPSSPVISSSSGHEPHNIQGQITWEQLHRFIGPDDRARARTWGAASHQHRWSRTSLISMWSTV